MTALVQRRLVHATNEGVRAKAAAAIGVQQGDLPATILAEAWVAETVPSVREAIAKAAVEIADPPTDNVCFAGCAVAAAGPARRAIASLN